MALYSYVKTPPGKGRFFLTRKLFFCRLKKILPLFSLTIGVSLIFVVGYYLAAYKFLIFQKTREKIIAPISELKLAESKGFISPLVAGVSTTATNTNQKNGEIDYDLINNWFPTAPIPPANPSKITHYTLSIPKLKIDQAVVEIGGTRVKQSLVQYPGTALPGEYGNTVIFGHSVLPMFYNPKDYKTIFSLLPTLKEKDKIVVDYDGISYSYEVFDYQEVKPEEIKVLEQRFDQQTLSLVTCVPPGTYLKRGIIRARLMEI